MMRIIVLSFLVAACSSAPTDAQHLEDLGELDSGATYFPTTEWRRAQPAQLGFDSARTATLLRDITTARYGAIDGLVIVRHGYVIAEKYNGFSPTVPHTMQSVSKSVTSLIFGIAAQQAGGNGDIDRPLLEVLEDYPNVANVDARKRALTLRHLLSMRTSMDFWEQPYPGSPLDQLNRSTSDWVKFVLDRPMTGTPGTQWSYNSGAAIVMCGVIREITGEDAAAFAHRKLFAPLGINDEWWYKSPYDGLPHCGGGLNLRATDLARIGYLVLRRGRWGETQVVPSSWIDASTTAYTRGDPVYFSNYGSAYGYFWWLFPRQRGGSDSSIIAASGSGGQWLFIIPSLDIVVAMIATDGYGLDLLYDGVLRALK